MTGLAFHCERRSAGSPSPPLRKRRGTNRAVHAAVLTPSTYPQHFRFERLRQKTRELLLVEAHSPGVRRGRGILREKSQLRETKQKRSTQINEVSMENTKRQISWAGRHIFFHVRRRRRPEDRTRTNPCRAGAAEGNDMSTAAPSSLLMTCMSRAATLSLYVQSRKHIVCTSRQPYHPPPCAARARVRVSRVRVTRCIHPTPQKRANGKQVR